MPLFSIPITESRRKKREAANLSRPEPSVRDGGRRRAAPETAPGAGAGAGVGSKRPGRLVRVRRRRSAETPGPTSSTSSPSSSTAHPFYEVCTAHHATALVQRPETRVLGCLRLARGISSLEVKFDYLFSYISIGCVCISR